MFYYKPDPDTWDSRKAFHDKARYKLVVTCSRFIFGLLHLNITATYQLGRWQRKMSDQYWLSIVDKEEQQVVYTYWNYRVPEWLQRFTDWFIRGKGKITKLQVHSYNTWSSGVYHIIDIPTKLTSGLLELYYPKGQLKVYVVSAYPHHMAHTNHLVDELEQTSQPEPTNISWLDVEINVPTDSIICKAPITIRSKT